MLTVRKSYRRVVRDARLRDTAELIEGEERLRHHPAVPGTASPTALVAARAVLRERGHQLPPIPPQASTGPHRPG
jgi:hypothetical protein